MILAGLLLIIVFLPYKSLYPAWKIVDSYKRVMAADSSDGVTPEMKQIASKLIQQIDKLSDNIYNTRGNILGKSGSYANHDTATGTQILYAPANYPSTMTDLSNPKTSQGTDLRATLFCASGKFKPDSPACS